jgi:hypothetical protein
VLEYNTPLTNGTVADRVFGQGGSFTSDDCNKGGISASSLCRPLAVSVDQNGNVYIADTGNERVLEYNSPLSSDTVADLVFGQGGSFTSDVCNKGGISASTLCSPFDVTVDQHDNVYIVDTGNERVLEYNTPLSSDTVADLVFGQGDSFTTNDHNKGGRSARSLSDPAAVALDDQGNVYIADNGNNRVLEFNATELNIPRNGKPRRKTESKGDTAADLVFGQGGSFTSPFCNKGGLSASSLCDPFSVRLDSHGNLYVADTDNNRVLEFDSPLSSPDHPGRHRSHPG